MHVRNSAQIEHMTTAELVALMNRITPQQMRDMLVFICGHCPAAFGEALKAHGGVCAVQADGENWCILSAGHIGSHNAGEFTWDVWPADQAQTIAAG